MDITTQLQQALGELRVRTQEPLVKYTTLRVGGPAQYFYIAQTQEELERAYVTAKKLGLPVWVLGGGTNVVISDSGLPGLVIRNETRHIKIVKQLGKVIDGKLTVSEALVEAETGALINQLVRFSADSGLAGLERHLGLPGTMGGALYMNSKWTKPPTYVGDVLHQAKLVTDKGEIKIVERKYFDFAYDQSILQKTHELVLSATFILKQDTKEAVWERAQASMAYRKETQPMGVASAGCTFRNISQADAFRLATPDYTTSAGFLVDQVGLKNFQIGQAKFSDKHANFILNLGGATASDVKALITEAQKRVKEKFQVDIEPEIVLLGDFS